MSYYSVDSRSQSKKNLYIVYWLSLRFHSKKIPFEDHDNKIIDNSYSTVTYSSNSNGASKSSQPCTSVDRSLLGSIFIFDLYISSMCSSS